MLIVLIFAHLKCNIDAMNEYTVKRIPIPMWDFSENTPGVEVDKHKGGVAGGSILPGVPLLETAEIPPEVATKDCTGLSLCQPIYSRVVSLRIETK